MKVLAIFMHTRCELAIVDFLTRQDFDLGGVANALDMPGLSAIIRKIVQEQLGAFMVLPNKFTMQLAESVTPKQLKCPDTAGRINLYYQI